MKKAGITEIARALCEEVEVIAERLGSPETREALTAFQQKRKPNFRQFR